MEKKLAYIFAALLVTSAIMHVVKPEFYTPMVPKLISVSLANILASISELTVAVLLLLPKYRKLGSLMFLFLMLAFLPIHIWDLFRENPVIGKPPLPFIRLIIQFLLIYTGWWIYKKHRSYNA